MAFGIVQQTLLDSLALTQLLEEGDEVQESQTWRNLRPEEQQQKQQKPKTQTTRSADERVLYVTWQQDVVYMSRKTPGASVVEWGWQRVLQTVHNSVGSITRRQG